MPKSTIEIEISEPKYIKFVEGPAKPRTKTWLVATIDGCSALGHVVWHGPWRGYVFFAREYKLFDKTCLRDIANFCEEQTRAHRRA